MKKLSSLLLVTLLVTIGCEKLSKEDILVEDPDLLALSQGLDSDIGLSKSSLNSLNDALNRHGKNGKHREPGFLWKVSAALQTSLSDDEKERLFGWMDDQLVPYLYGTGMDDRRGKGPGDHHHGGMDLRMISSVLDSTQKVTLRSILDSYRTQMGSVMEKVKAGTLSKDDAKVELEALETEDFVRILTEPKGALVTQYRALMATEGLDVSFTDEAVRRVAEYASLVNERSENIGARRLHTVMEKLLDEISFEAPDMTESTVVIDEAYVDRMLSEIVKDEDLSRYIL